MRKFPNRYYGTSNDHTKVDGDMLDLTHTLATKVGVVHTIRTSVSGAPTDIALSFRPPL